MYFPEKKIHYLQYLFIMVTATQKIWGMEVKYPVATSNMMLKTSEICRLRADSTLFESKELCKEKQGPYASFKLKTSWSNLHKHLLNKRRTAAP